MARAWTNAQEAAMKQYPKTLLVSAAAGSGKTSVLTERIIRSLTQKEHPADLSRMLIVTFTRAAAAELKSRIASALSDALAENPDNAHLSHQLFLLGSAQISTIDSFFQRTVRDHFEQLNIPSTFRIADDNELDVLSAETLNSVIEEFYRTYTPESAEGSALSIIRSNRFAASLNHLLTNRSDGKLIPLLLEFYNQFSKDPMGIDRLKALAVQLRAECGLPFLQTSYGKTLKKIYTDLFSEDLELLQDFFTRLSGDPAADVLCSGLLSSDRDFAIAVLRDMEKDDLSALYRTAQSFFRGTFRGVSEKTTDILRYQSFRDIYKKHVEALQGDLTEANEDLADQILRTAELCEMLHLLLKTYRDRFLDEKRSRGVLEYDDVRGMLYEMLVSPDGAPTPFAKSLAAQYDAVYIDEYQDVDRMQDGIFAAIGNDRRFMVGDIKQSIYGFRGSEPSIFAEYRRAFPLYDEQDKKDASGLCVFMSENFRCDQPIIDFTNQVCSFLFSASEASVGYRDEDDLQCSKKHDQPLPSTHPVPVQIAVFPPFSAKKTKAALGMEEDDNVDKPEAIWTAKEIERLIKEETLDSGEPIKPCDIVILVRSKKHGKAVLHQLNKRRIPARCEVSENPLHAPIMVDFINLLRVIDNPYRDLPLSEFLLSPLGGFTLEEVHILREALSSRHALFDALEHGAELPDASLAEKAKTTVTWLEKQRKLAAVQPADRFLHLLYLEDKVKPYTELPAFRYLYEQARVYQRSSWCGLYGFLQHVTKLLEKDEIKAGAASTVSAVTVMTIHHSKGLEFPVVFLHNSAAYFNKDDLKKSMIYHKEAGFASLLYNEDSSVQEDNLLRTAVKRAVEQDLVEENIRTLYVALTRARERLYVTGTLRGKWETAQAQAQAIRRGKRMSILKGYSYMTWILAAIAEQGTNEGQYHALLHYFSPQEIAELQDLQEGDGANTEEPSVSASLNTAASLSDADSRYVQILKDRETYRYPFSALEGLPTKVAASRLRPGLLDDMLAEDEDERSIQAHLELMEKEISFDTLLDAHGKAKATDIGTATHAFLEFCDFERLAANGLDAECARLLADCFISPTTEALLNREQLNAFLKSDLMQWLLSAREVQRELTFGLFFPMQDLTARSELSDQLRDQTIFVQGSIDLLITLPSGKRILIDYKTDRLTERELTDDLALTEKMKRSHGYQLACYAKAVEALFGSLPDEVRIYSLPAGRTVAIPLEEIL